MKKLNNKEQSIVIDNIPFFRLELIKMIEKVKYNIDDYDKLTSTQIAEKFENKIKSKLNNI